MDMNYKYCKMRDLILPGSRLLQILFALKPLINIGQMSTCKELEEFTELSPQIMLTIVMPLPNAV